MTKMKKHKHIDRIKRVTTIFGYILFALSLVSLTLYTVIPFGSLFFNPAVQHFNIALILGSLVAGAVLPTLIAYILGDKSTRTKSKLDHHFNGVLFAIASYWLSNLFVIVNSDFVRDIQNDFPLPIATIIDAWPIFAVVLILAVVAIIFAKNNNKITLLELRPYQYILLGSIMAQFGYGIVYSLFHDTNYFTPVVLYCLIPILIFSVLFIAMSHIDIPKQFRLTSTSVAFSIGFISMTIGSQFLHSSAYFSDFLWSLTIGILVVVIYVILIHRK